MKAMIFAAGLGTRLRPLTDSVPKALVPVGGTPMLQRIILNLKNAGFDNITINVHHFPDMIIDFLKSNQNFGIDIAVSDERKQLLDTGGGIAKAAAWLDGTEPFLVHNADILTDLDLKDIYAQHMENNADATLAISDRKTSRYLLFDHHMEMKGWISESTGEIRPSCASSEGLRKLAFNGIHVISPSLLPELTSFRGINPFSITEFYIENCHAKSLFGYLPSYRYSWFDIGKPESLTAANNYLKHQSH